MTELTPDQYRQLLAELRDRNPPRDNADAVNATVAQLGHVTRVSRNDHGTYSFTCTCGAAGDGPSSGARSDKGNQKRARRAALDHKRFVLGQVN